MRIRAQWKSPSPEVSDEDEPPAGVTSARVTVLVNGELVCVTVPDVPPHEPRDGICRCGGCLGGSLPDSAADYL